MSQIEAQEGRELFTSSEQDDVITALAEPLEDDRPINLIDTGIAPEGRKTHAWYMHSVFQWSVIFLVFSLVGWALYALIFGGRTPKIVVAGEAQQITELKRRLQEYEGTDEDKLRENVDLTQGAQFEAIPLEQQKPKAKSGNLAANQRQPNGQPKTQTPGKPETKKTTPQPPRSPITRANTVALNRPQYPTPRPPIRTRQAPTVPKPVSKAQPNKPSLSECAEHIQTGLDVPACSGYGIKVKAPAKAAPVTLGQTSPKPTTPKPVKPIQLKPYKRPKLTAYNQQKAPKKPSHQVNFVAGEIQTMDQYEQEFYGPDSSAKPNTPNVSKMSAKVVRHVEWRSQDEAQKTIIPLTITSGPHKGQSAEAKITSLNGTQFTAELTKLNGQTVEPGQYAIEQKNTTYLLAQQKSQGGSSFGNKILNTALAVGGEMASDQLANVRGGSHISNLVPQGQQQQGSTGQYWKFAGKVDIVAKF